MGVPITYNGVVYTIPVQGDTRWGPELTRYLIALGTFGAVVGAPLTANTVPVTNGLGQLVSSPVTTTTLGFLDATSSIQTQLNAITGSGITALTGDGTATGPGSVPLTLATVNATPGTYVSANITVNAKGLITAAANGAGGGTVTNVTGTANQIDSTGGAAPVLSLSSTLIFPGSITGTLTGHSTLDLALTGGTMSGAIAMGANKITGLANGTVATDAVAFGQLPAAPVAGQIVGTATNDNAAAGNVGQYVESVVANVTYPATTVFGDATSISLTAGDWDVTLVMLMSPVVVGAIVHTTGISFTPGNSTTGLVLGSNELQTLSPATGDSSPMTIAGYRISIGATTTVYAKYQASYASTAPKFYGRISARRAR